MLAFGASSLLLFLLVLELVFRFGRFDPRFQIVRASRNPTLASRNGVPIWRGHGSEERENAGCIARNPGALKVVYFGSSIFFGVTLEPGEVFTALLQREVDTRFGPGAVCVVNYAQPGYDAASKMAVARGVLGRMPGAVVVWELWGNDPRPYAFLGENAYSLQDARVDALGYPDAFPVPSPLHHFLFRRSRAYEYATLAFVRDQPVKRSWDDLVRGRVIPIMDELASSLRAQGSELWLVGAARLDRPFSGQIEATDNHVVRAWAKQQAARYDELAALLKDQDHLAIRLDPCCHYNAAGHAVIASRMLPLLVPRITNRLARTGSPTRNGP